MALAEIQVKSISLNLKYFHFYTHILKEHAKEEEKEKKKPTDWHTFHRV